MRVNQCSCFSFSMIVLLYCSCELRAWKSKRDAGTGSAFLDCTRERTPTSQSILVKTCSVASAGSAPLADCLCGDRSRDSLRTERYLHRSTGHCSCILKLRNLIASGRFHATSEDIPDEEVTPAMLGSMPSTSELETEEAEQKARRRSVASSMRLDALSYLIWLTLVTIAPGNILMTLSRA